MHNVLQLQLKHAFDYICWLYTWSRNCLLVASTWVQSQFSGGVRVAHHFFPSSCVLCAQCYQCLWIVFVLCLVCPMLPVSLDCLRPVSCVPNVTSVSGLSSSCVLCAQCYQCLWIVFVLCLVFPMLPVSLDCLRPVSCVPNVTRLSVLDCPFLIVCSWLSVLDCLCGFFLTFIYTSHKLTKWRIISTIEVVFFVLELCTRSQK